MFWKLPCCRIVVPPPKYNWHVIVWSMGVVCRSNGLAWCQLSAVIENHSLSFRLSLQINGGRQLSGILRGYDPFMNLVIDEAIEKKKTGEQQQVGYCAAAAAAAAVDLSTCKSSCYLFLLDPNENKQHLVCFFRPSSAKVPKWIYWYSTSYILAIAKIKYNANYSILYNIMQYSSI